MCHKDTLWRRERASLRAIHRSHQEARKLAEYRFRYRSGKAGLECVCVCCTRTCYDHVRTSWNVMFNQLSPNWTINKYSGDDNGFDYGNASAAAFSDGENYHDYDDDGRYKDINSDVIS